MSESWFSWLWRSLFPEPPPVRSPGPEPTPDQFGFLVAMQNRLDLAAEAVGMADVHAVLKDADQEAATVRMNAEIDRVMHDVWGPTAAPDGLEARQPPAQTTRPGARLKMKGGRMSPKRKKKRARMRRVEVYGKRGDWKVRGCGKAVPPLGAFTKAGALRHARVMAKRKATERRPIQLYTRKANGRWHLEATYPRSADPRRSKG